MPSSSWVEPRNLLRTKVRHPCSKERSSALLRVAYAVGGSPSISRGMLAAVIGAHVPAEIPGAVLCVREVGCSEGSDRAGKPQQYRLILKLLVVSCQAFTGGTGFQLDCRQPKLKWSDLNLKFSPRHIAPHSAIPSIIRSVSTSVSRPESNHRRRAVK